MWILGGWEVYIEAKKIVSGVVSSGGNKKIAVGVVSESERLSNESTNNTSTSDNNYSETKPKRKRDKVKNALTNMVAVAGGGGGRGINNASTSDKDIPAQKR